MSNCLNVAPINLFLLSLLQGSDCTLLWHFIVPFKTQALVSYRHRTRDGEKKTLTCNFFRNRRWSSMSHCQRVGLYISSPVSQECKRLMVVLRAGKTHLRNAQHCSLLWKMFHSSVAYVIHISETYNNTCFCTFYSECPHVSTAVSMFPGTVSGAVCPKAALINESH